MYTTLDASREEIRLISIANSTDGPGDLNCTMETVSLSDWTTAYQDFRDHVDDTLTSPTNLYDDWIESLDSRSQESPRRSQDRCRFLWGDYHTLSYTWETASDSQHAILVNGEKFEVRRNLYDALSHFRECGRYASRVKLWTDAICINQNDILERALQVKRMKDIYSTAIQTTIWLGKDLGPAYSAVINTKDYFEQLGSILDRTAELMPEQPYDETTTTDSESSEDEESSWSDYDSSEEEEVMAQQELLLQDERLLVAQLGESAEYPDLYPLGASSEYELYIYLVLALQPIIDNEYWRRVWIIQELAASSARSPITIGSSTIDLAQLLGVVNHVMSSTTGLVLCNPYPYVSVRNTFHFIQLLYRIRGIADPDDDKDSTNEQWHWFFQGLASRSTLTSDKFYGILGVLSSDDLSEVSVDYALPVPRFR